MILKPNSFASEEKKWQRNPLTASHGVVLSKQTLIQKALIQPFLGSLDAIAPLLSSSVH